MFEKEVKDMKYFVAVCMSTSGEPFTIPFFASDSEMALLAASRRVFPGNGNVFGVFEITEAEYEKRKEDF